MPHHEAGEYRVPFFLPILPPPAHGMMVDPEYTKDTLHHERWLKATVGWSPLRVAVSLRMHREATKALRLGYIDPDSYQYDVTAVIEAATCEDPLMDEGECGVGASLNPGTNDTEFEAELSARMCGFVW